MIPEDALPTGRSEPRILSEPNLLISEKSPYLLQHAFNPVNWHPWSEQAFELARREDRPIFLSVGYSTCHWCHVMARESFEDPKVAELINDAFVPVKVDREERPDIDQIFMSACQAMTGRGGWPLTIIMTPDKKPFFAATYIPKMSRFGSAGLMEIIPRIRELWTHDRQRLLDSAENIAAHLEQTYSSQPETTMDASALEKAYQELVRLFDPQSGGFGSAPKFPTPHILLFLLRYWRRTKEAYALEMVEATLQAMRRGGIYDHIGFGFHRYSTDAFWFVPHFEKMLYDQALLTMAYLEGHQATGKELYAKTAMEILTYVQREMTFKGGGFFSAEDADSEGEEGRFYLWTVDELRGLLDKEEYRLLAKVFDLVDDGNFERGRNIFALRSSLEDAASVLGIPQDGLEERLEKIRQRLIEARERRSHPHKDDKILTDWNGLMIAALARASQVLDDPDYARAAQAAAEFVLEKMRLPDGRLLHRFRGEPGIPANLDDYSFIIWGLIELYEAIFEADCLQAALDLNSIMMEHFWDRDGGGFYFTPDDGERLLFRQKEIHDGALPSGNSVAMLNLLRLSHLTGEHQYYEHAEKIRQAFSGLVARRPAAHTMFMTSLDFALGPVYEVGIAGTPGAADTREMLEALRSSFIPSKSVILVPSGQESPPIHRLAEYAKDFSAIDGKATAFVCEDHACRLPTADAKKMLELLESWSTNYSLQQNLKRHR